MLKREIIIDNFSEYIQTASKIMPKPYEKRKGFIPKKYNNSDYEFRKIKYRGKEIEALVRKSDGIMIPSNSRTVSRPRIKKVNGQDVYNQNAMTFGRNKIVQILHEYFRPKFKDLEPLTNVDEFPLLLDLTFEINDMGKLNVDNDNKWIWRKCIQDTMTELGIIPDDNVNVISKNSEETILIPEGVEQRLIIRLYGK